MTAPIHLAVALDGAGWHPAAWREESARPTELLSPRYWIDQVRTAQDGLLDLVTLEDSLTLRHGTTPDRPRTDTVAGHLDATLIASRVAPATTSIGIIPTAVVTHTEPFHLSKAIATLDYVSTGRAGVRLRVSARDDEARLIGRREIADHPLDDLLAEAGDHAEVLRRLWDSWEDDAEIRDVATGRFVDRDKLHYIDFEGRFFSVRGPSITPRPPQGQPIIAALAHRDPVYRFAGAAADLTFITPRDADDTRDIVGRIGAARFAAGRDDEVGHVFVDLAVFLGATDAEAAARKERLDDRAEAEFTSDAEIFVGTAAGLADRISDLVGPHTGATGVRLRPGAIPDDLESITRELVPELQRRNQFRTEYAESTLRERLGLTRPANRYAQAGAR